MALTSSPIDRDMIITLSCLYMVGTSVSPSFAATRYSTRRPATTKSSGNSSIAMRT